MTKVHLRLQDTPIAGVQVVHRSPIQDERGSFERVFCGRELAHAGFGAGAVQINRSRTRAAGAVRGLHFQGGGGREAKLVTCLRGAVHDVAVDVRAGSATFGQAFTVRLHEDGDTALLLPPGVAHGFQALTDDAELLYLHSAYYEPALDVGVSAMDPRISIDWPLQVHGLSARDAAWPLLSDLQPWSAQT
jgi:dTDP-4-dehydrorhamnose 3,5-epimerase